MSSPLLLKTNKFDDEFLSMLKLRGYAIYSFGYLKNQVESKIVNAITTELQGWKSWLFAVYEGEVCKKAVSSVMKRLETICRTQGGQNTITTPPMVHSVKLQH